MGADSPLWVDLMSAMTGVLGSDDEAIDLATDLLVAIGPHVERENRDAETLAKVRWRWAVVPWGATDSQMVSFAEDVAALLAGES